MKKTIEYSQEEISELLIAPHRNSSLRHSIITWDCREEFLKAKIEVFDNKEEWISAGGKNESHNTFEL